MDNKNKELINYFFKVIGDERFIRILENFSNGEGYGIENVGVYLLMTTNSGKKITLEMRV